jgi:hypothetical protein
MAYLGLSFFCGTLLGGYLMSWHRHEEKRDEMFKHYIDGPVDGCLKNDEKNEYFVCTDTGLAGVKDINEYFSIINNISSNGSRNLYHFSSE